MGDLNKCPLCYSKIEDGDFKKLPYCKCSLTFHPECYEIFINNKFECPVCNKYNKVKQKLSYINKLQQNISTNVFYIADKILETHTYYTVPLYVLYIISVVILFLISMITIFLIFFFPVYAYIISCVYLNNGGNKYVGMPVFVLTTIYLETMMFFMIKDVLLFFY
jgi:hypothetical protein